MMFSAYKKKIGFNGVFLIEPKPKEPSKHQYDYGKTAQSSVQFKMVSTRPGKPICTPPYLSEVFP